MNTARLTAKLGSAGYDLDRLEKLDRRELLEALAEAMLEEPALESPTDFVQEACEASQVPLPVENSSSAAWDGGSVAVRLRELELEEKRAVRETEERKAAREAQKLAIEAEEQKAACEAKAQRLALEAERAQREWKPRRES